MSGGPFGEHLEFSSGELLSGGHWTKSPRPGSLPPSLVPLTSHCFRKLSASCTTVSALCGSPRAYIVRRKRRAYASSVSRRSTSRGSYSCSLSVKESAVHREMGPRVEGAGLRALIGGVQVSRSCKTSKERSSTFENFSRTPNQILHPN